MACLQGETCYHCGGFMIFDLNGHRGICEHGHITMLSICPNEVSMSYGILSMWGNWTYLWYKTLEHTTCVNIVSRNF